MGGLVILRCLAAPSRSRHKRPPVILMVGYQQIRRCDCTNGRTFDLTCSILGGRTPQHQPLWQSMYDKKA